jgi:ectoine hydroxylase-related dioxygenase (phytanoyl-CoA dioxygenase family)
LITQDHIDHFKRHGYCVVHDVASPAAVAELRRQLHRHVRHVSGVDYARLTVADGRKLRESGALSQGSVVLFIFFLAVNFPSLFAI